MDPCNAAILIITDIHVRSSTDDSYFYLLDRIRGVNPKKIKAVVLLGDIFDFFLGNNPYFRNKYSEFIHALDKLAHTTCEVYYIQGNHEYALALVPWKKVQIIESSSLILSLEKKNLAFCHGDFLFPSAKYKLALAFLRSKFLMTILGFVPGLILDKVCLAYARYSHSKAKLNNEGKMKEAAKKWLTELRADEGFVGHFHQNLKLNFNKGKVNFLSPGLMTKVFHQSRSYQS